MRWLDRLLDDRRLEGVYPVTRELSPELYVAVVDRDLGDAVDVVERACQQWGGACTGLVTVEGAVGSGSGQLEPPWVSLVERGHFDCVAARDLLTGKQVEDH